MTPIPDSRPMSHSRGEISTFVMPSMQNALGDLFGGHLMAMVDQAVGVAVLRMASALAPPKWNEQYAAAKPYTEAAKKLHEPPTGHGPVLPPPDDIGH